MRVQFFPLGSGYQCSKALQLFKDSHAPYNSLEITSILRPDLGPEEFTVHLIVQFWKRFNSRPVEHKALCKPSSVREEKSYVPTWIGHKSPRRQNSQGARLLVLAPSSSIRTPTVRATSADVLSPVQIPWSCVNTSLIQLIRAKLNQCVLPT